MQSARKSIEKIGESSQLPRPGQNTMMRYSDNNYYGMNTQINMSKSNVFSKTDMPQQLSFKTGPSNVKFSTIITPAEMGKLSFKDSTGGIKKYNTIMTTQNNQSEIPFNHKQKGSQTSFPPTSNNKNLQSNSRLSGDGSFQTKPSLHQSLPNHNICQTPITGNKLQFKQSSNQSSNTTIHNAYTTPIYSKSPQAKGTKQTIQNALKQTVGSNKYSLKPSSQGQDQNDNGRLDRYRQKPYKDFSENFSDKQNNQRFSPNSLGTNNQKTLQNSYKPTVSISGGNTNPYKNNDKPNEQFSNSVANNLYYHSYPHPNFVNPFHKDSKIFQSTDSTNFASSPLESPNLQKIEFSETKVEGKVDRLTPNSENSNFSKFKKNSISSGNPSTGFKERVFQPSPQKVDKLGVKLSDFKLGKKLGKGKFGDVYFAQDIKTNFVCALKVIKKQILIDEKVDHQFSRQLKIQFYLNHPNIASLYGFFDDQTNFYMLLEYAIDGHLFSILKQQKRFSQDETKVVIKQVCEGVEYMHKQRILHRDLKPQNILIQMGIPKICDFGWAIYRADTLRDTFCGTPLYISPQILTGQKYDQGADLWAVGILTYQLLIGKIPFKIRTQSDLIKIINQQITFPQHIPLSSICKDFIMRMLQRDPDERYDIEQLLNHEFLSQKQQGHKSFP